MDFKDLVAFRRSHRRYSNKSVSAEDLHLILRAALMSPTSKSCHKWEFVVVENKSLLKQIAKAKNTGGEFIEEAPLAIVICGSPDEDDCWIEDAAIAAITIQYQAAELNLGSCWTQIRGRNLNDGTYANKILHNLLGLNKSLEVLCVIAIGYYTDERKLQNEDALKWEKITKL